MNSAPKSSLCRKRVGVSTVTYSCTLPDRHDGPCVAAEIARTQQHRNEWEMKVRIEQARKSQEVDASRLREFQGPLQTTAERYTEGASVSPYKRSSDAKEDTPVPAQISKPDHGALTGNVLAGNTYISGVALSEAIRFLSGDMSDREALEVLAKRRDLGIGG